MYLFCYDTKINKYEMLMNILGLEGFSSIQMEGLQKLLKLENLANRSYISKVSGLRRGWYLHRCNMSMIAAYENKKSKCNGIIYKLSKEEFEVISNIYYGYKYISLKWEDVETDIQDKSISVGCYVIDKSMIDSPDSKYPIYQSVIDTTLMGCIDRGGIEYAKEFVTSTSSWNKNWWKKEESYEIIDQVLKETLGEDLVKKIVSLDFRRIKNHD